MKYHYKKLNKYNLYNLKVELEELPEELLDGWILITKEEYHRIRVAQSKRRPNNK